MKKKITAALLCAAMVLSLSGCAGNEKFNSLFEGINENNSTESKPTASKPNESKPEESKPMASKPNASKPEESKPEESSSDESKPEESSTESKPEEKPKPVETVDWSKIEYADELDFMVEDVEGGVVITQYIGTEPIVKIPQTINGKTVVKLGKSSNPVFPSSVTDVSIPNSVKKILKYSFKECNSLKSVVLPDNYDNSSGYAFINNCPSKNPVYTFLGKTYRLSEDKIKLQDALYPGTGKMLIKDGTLYRVSITIKDVVIPSDVTSIDECAFYNCDLIEEITIPVDLINYITRHNYSDNRKVSFGETGGGSFINNCPNLKSVTFAEGVTKIEANYRSDEVYDRVSESYIGAGIFYKCPKLETINLPKSLTEIGKWTFAECTALKSITIPENVKELKAGTFLGCTALESVTLPDGLTKISEDCFGEDPPKNLQVTYKGKTYKSNQLPNLYKAVNG